MSIKFIEGKFEILDQRLKRLSDYFCPANGSGPKHPYINDLKQDYNEDSRKYKLDKFYQINTCRSLSPILPQSNQETLPSQLKELSKPKDSKPRRKRIKSDAMDEKKINRSYKGIFSCTKLSPECSKPSGLQSYQSKILDSWAGSIGSIPFQHSTDSILFNLEDPKFFKQSPEEISQEYIRQSFLELNNFTSKNSRFSISPGTLHGKKRKRGAQLPDDLIIKYQTDPILEIKADKGKYSITVTDIGEFVSKTYSDLVSDNGFIQFSKGKKINLEEEFDRVADHTFSVSVKGTSAMNFYVSFKKYSYENERNIIKNVRRFKELSENKTFDQVRLPKILENGDNEMKKIVREFKNPITGPMFKFRDNNKLYHPGSYIAKLSLFEQHASIRKKYLKKTN